MNTLGGGYGVARAAASERNATNDILTIGVGQAIKRKLIFARHDFRWTVVGAQVWVVSVRNAIGIGIVKSIFFQTFVKGPVEFKSCLTSTEQAVVSGDNLVVGKRAIPYSHFIDVSLESVVMISSISTTNSHFNLVIGICWNFASVEVKSGEILEVKYVRILDISVDDKGY